MACISYSIRWSSSQSTVCSGGGTSATFSINNPSGGGGTLPGVGDTWYGNAACGASPLFGGAHPVYIIVD